RVLPMILPDGLVAGVGLAVAAVGGVAVRDGERRGGGRRGLGSLAGRPDAAAGGDRRDQYDDGAGPHAAAPAAGRVTVKRLPCPGWDSTVTRPPCASTMLFTMASPSPVPAAAPGAWT